MALVLSGDGKISGANLNIDSDGAATFTQLSVEGNTTVTGNLNLYNSVGPYSTFQVVPAATIGSSDNTIRTINTTGISFETGGSERMNIDTVGRILTPSQPMFRATGVGGWVTVTANNLSDMVISNVQTNVGSHFNSSNYRFTAPVFGKYIFQMGIYGRIASGGNGDNTNYWLASFYKNGSRMNPNTIMGYQNAGDYDSHLSDVLIVELNASDYVDVKFRAIGANAEYYGQNCIFSGYLLG